MHHYLREAAKIATGLVIADLVSVIWLGAAGFFPLTILGVTWTDTSILPIALCDIALIILFVHFGWNAKVPLRSPSEKTLLIVAGFVFLVVALAHLLRIAFGLNLALGDFMVPAWLSWFGVIITAYLSYCCFHFAMRRTR